MIRQVTNAWRAAWRSIEDDPEREGPNAPRTSLMPRVQHDLDAEVRRLVEALAKIEGLQEFAGSPGWQEAQNELDHVINEQTRNILTLSQDPRANEMQLIYATAYRGAVILLHQILNLDRLDIQSDGLTQRLYGLYQKQQETAISPVDSQVETVIG